MTRRRVRLGSQISSFQEPPGEDGEEQFDLLEPGGVFGGVVGVESGLVSEPGLDHTVLPHIQNDAYGPSTHTLFDKAGSTFNGLTHDLEGANGLALRWIASAESNRLVD